MPHQIREEELAFCQRYQMDQILSQMQALNNPSNLVTPPWNYSIIPKSQNLKLEQEVLSLSVSDPKVESEEKEVKIKKRIKKTMEEKRKEFLLGKDFKQTKNIPKNFTKAAIIFCLKNKEYLERIIPQTEKREAFVEYLKNVKFQTINIKKMRNLLIGGKSDTEKQYGSYFRIIMQAALIFNNFKYSYRKYFIKNVAVSYIFNSRIQQVNWHLHYKHQLLQCIANPSQFKTLKVFKD